MQLSLNASELVRSNELVSGRLLRLSICWLGTITPATNGHSGGTRKLESQRGGRNEAITVMRGDCLCNGNYYHNDYLQG